jgi:hypothetical protein
MWEMRAHAQVMCAWPRVSMGRPFLEKFADVQWEVNEEHLQAWKDGKTGYPIVDAAMRACAQRGECGLSGQSEHCAARRLGCLGSNTSEQQH